MTNFSDYINQYLEKTIPGFADKKRLKMFLCPKCQHPGITANFLPFRNNIIQCLNGECDFRGNIYDVVKLYEKKPEWSNEIIENYLKEFLNLNIITCNDIDKALDFYEKNGWDLLLLCKNSKVPIEKEWQIKEHKNKEEWKKWITEGFNIGAKTGERSNITVLDLDGLTNSEKEKIRFSKITAKEKKVLLEKKATAIKKIYEEVGNLFGKTLKQYDLGGEHFFYQYEKDLPKTSINTENYHIDLENNGGYIVLFPSKLGNTQRKIELNEIIKMPDNLKQWIQLKIKPNIIKPEINEQTNLENFHCDLIKEGNRTNILMQLGGIFKKELNIKQTSFVLDVINNRLTDKPKPCNEFSNIIKSLDKYFSCDNKEIIERILNYLKSTDIATKYEIESFVTGQSKALGETKKIIDSSLIYLLNEGYIAKKGRNNYHIIKKANWRTDLVNIGNPIDFVMPYFDDIAYFNWSDLLLLGGKSKRGKTHLAVNILKRLVQQNIKPYYISLESGSRFAKIAMKLGLKEGDFFWDDIDPREIELEKNSVTILDWLLIQEKAETDTVFQHLINELKKTQGILIVFQQLKKDNEWFAPNMCKQFPSFVAKYIFDNEQEGTYGKFVIEEVREIKNRIYEIPCVYNHETKELKRMDELE